LKEIPLFFEKVLYEAGDSIPNVYFSTSGIVSLLSGVEDRAALEVGQVGRKGVVGVPIFIARATE